MRALALEGQRGGTIAGHRLACLLAAVAISMVMAIAPAAALTIDVKADDGTKVGEVRVHIAPDGSGVMGGFVSSYGDPPSLDAAAQKCGEDHFNWYQLVMGDNMPPHGPDGKLVSAPYWDPPLGGYGWPDTQWADGLPWYWDEGPDPAKGTPGFVNGLNVDDNKHDPNGDGADEVLGFADFPAGPVGTEVQFQTWLVSVNADGSIHEFHEGFVWSWTNPDEDPDGSPGAWGNRRWPWTFGLGVGTLDESQIPLTPEAGLDSYNRMTAIPEPASLTLLAFGLAALGARRRPRAAA